MTVLSTVCWAGSLLGIAKTNAVYYNSSVINHKGFKVQLLLKPSQRCWFNCIIILRMWFMVLVNFIALYNVMFLLFSQHS